jgi:hypothetical protein
MSQRLLPSAQPRYGCNEWDDTAIRLSVFPQFRRSHFPKPFGLSFGEWERR